MKTFWKNAGLLLAVLLIAGFICYRGGYFDSSHSTPPRVMIDNSRVSHERAVLPFTNALCEVMTRNGLRVEEYAAALAERVDSAMLAEVTGYIGQDRDRRLPVFAAVLTERFSDDQLPLLADVLKCYGGQSGCVDKFLFADAALYIRPAVPASAQ